MVSFARKGQLPGYGLSLGVTFVYLGLLVLLPLGVLLVRLAGVSLDDVAAVLLRPRTRAAFWLSLRVSLIAAAINAVFGLSVAWVLVRYRFFGRRVLDAVVDLPLALPTAVAGIALVTMYSETGWLGAAAARAGVPLAFTPAAIVIALVFVGLPFVVRSVEPVLEKLDPEVEEAAATLGASRAMTFWRIVLPALRPALVSGTLLAFARGLGEYGSVVFVSGNMPLRTEIVPFLIMTKLDQYDYRGAMILAVAMLLVSLLTFLGVNSIEARLKRQGRR